MKSVKKLLFLFILMVLFNCKGVFAAGKTFEYNGLEFTISNVYLNVYDESEEFFDNYDEDSLIKKIDLTDSVKLTPEIVVFDATKSDSKSPYYNFINPGLDMSAEGILKVLKENVPLDDENDYYFVNCVVDYSVKKLSDSYGNYFNRYTYNVQNVEYGEVVPQIFNAFEYKLVNGSEYISYSDKYDSELYPFGSNAVYNILDDDIGIFSENNTVYSYFSFIGFNDLENFYNVLCDEYSSNYRNNGIVDRVVFADAEPFDEIVPIPNTFESSSIIYVVGGSLLLLLGGFVILKTLKQDKI